MKRALMIRDAVAISVRRSLLNTKAANVVKKLLADDQDESSDRSRLKVLNDGDGVKLLMSIYQDYVSDDDYVKFPEFMYNVDTLLYKARGNKTLTREEREEMEESAPKRNRRPKKRKPTGDGATPNLVKPNPEPVDGNDKAITASMSPLGNFFTRHLNQKRG